MASKSQIDNKDNPDLLTDLANAGSAAVVSTPESILTGAERESLKTMSDAEIKKFTGKLSYRTIIELLADPKTPASVRLGCAREGIDRDEGKAAQTVNNTNVSLTLPELVALSYKLPPKIVENLPDVSSGDSENG